MNRSGESQQKKLGDERGMALLAVLMVVFLLTLFGDDIHAVGGAGSRWCQCICRKSGSRITLLRRLWMW